MKLKLRDVDPDSIAIGMMIKTNYDQSVMSNYIMRTDPFAPTSVSFIQGTVYTKAGGSMVIKNCSFDGIRAIAPDWRIDFDSDAWIEGTGITAKSLLKPVKDYIRKKAKIDLDSVVLADEKKNQIREAISQVDNNQKIFQEWGFEEVFEKGTAISLLFYGVPGTGKTLMAQAIADKLEQKLLVVGPAEIETSTPGGAERNIKRHFKIAMGEMAPETGETDANGNPILGKKGKHVLLFDECDSLITNRDNVGIIMRGQINTLLSELENFDGIVIFTTNSIKSLDPAMERRITTKVEFEFPNKEMRRKIWERMIPKKAPLDRDVNFDKLAEFQFAGGNIKNIVLNAARLCAYAGLDKINLTCFLSAMEREAVGLKAFEATHLASTGRPHRKLETDIAADTSEGIRLEKVEPKKVRVRAKK